MSKSGEGGDGLLGTRGESFVSKVERRRGLDWELTKLGVKGDATGESVGVCTEDPPVSVLMLVALTVAKSSSSSASRKVVETVCLSARELASRCPAPCAFASDKISRIRSSVFLNRLRHAHAGYCPGGKPYICARPPGGHCMLANDGAPVVEKTEST